MKLFEPGRIGRLSIKNRIAMAPMGNGLLESDGRLSQRAIDYYIARAKGGTGLIISGVTRVWQENPLVRGHIRALNELTDAMHDYGAKFAVQLTAGSGRAGYRVSQPASVPVAPSVLPCFWDSSVMTHKLTIKEIEQLVQAFEFGAEIVRTAGVDAVELHGHEGYLFDEFQTALWNKRTDKYGGDLDGRLTFVREVIEAIKRGAGADFPIIYRFGLKHYLEGGREAEEGQEIARRLELAGVAAFDVDAGCYETHYWPHPTTYQPPGCMVDMAEMAKKVVNVPVMAVGNLQYPEVAERVLQEGKADFIILGRALLADPEWPNKVREVREGRTEDIYPCIGDNEGCCGRVTTGKYVSCTVNPMTGMEREFAIKPAEKKKSVLVVGGGPGGMEAARVATLRGHKVTLWEKGDALGGNLIPASVPNFKHDYRRLINYLSTQIKKLGVTIELGKEATPALVRKAKPDVVFIATGGTPLIPEIPGVKKKKVIDAIDLLLGKKEAGESVVVVGGGLVGCETALYLAQKGKKATIVARHDIAGDVFEANQQHLLKLLSDARMKVLTYTNTLGITDEGVTIADKSGNRSVLKADTVVLALGLEPDRRLFEALEGKLPEVYAIGDCVEPRKVINAIWEGFRLARLI